MDIYTLILSFLFSSIFVMNKKWKIRFFSCILGTKLKMITWLYFGNKKWFGLKNKNKNVDTGCSLPLKFWGPYIWLFHKEVAKYIVLSYILIEVSHDHQLYTITRKIVYPPPISKVASPPKYFLNHFTTIYFVVKWIHACIIQPWLHFQLLISK